MFILALALMAACLPAYGKGHKRSKVTASSASAPNGSAAHPKPAGSGGPYFRNCAEARAAGAAPIRYGEPGYAPHLDRDGDGVACEPYRKRR